MKTPLHKILRVAAIALLGTLVVSATPITPGSQLFLTGSVRVGPDFADWLPLGGPDGDFNVEPTSTGQFAAWADPTVAEDGKITDLDSAAAPVGVPISVPFMTFNLAPAYVFQLEFIEPGVFPPCVATPMCSANQFNVIQAGNATIVNFNVSGTVLFNGDAVNFFTGSFSQVFNNRTTASLFNEIATKGYIDSAFDGNFQVSAIPEPGTFGLLLIPAAALAIRARRRR